MNTDGGGDELPDPEIGPHAPSIGGASAETMRALEAMAEAIAGVIAPGVAADYERVMMEEGTEPAFPYVPLSSLAEVEPLDPRTVRLPRTGDLIDPAEVRAAAERYLDALQGQGQIRDGYVVEVNADGSADISVTPVAPVSQVRVLNQDEIDSLLGFDEVEDGESVELRARGEVTLRLEEPHVQKVLSPNADVKITVENLSRQRAISVTVKHSDGTLANRTPGAVVACVKDTFVEQNAARDTRIFHEAEQGFKEILWAVRKADHVLVAADDKIALLFDGRSMDGCTGTEAMAEILSGMSQEQIGDVLQELRYMMVHGKTRRQVRLATGVQPELPPARRGAMRTHRRVDPDT